MSARALAGLPRCSPTTRSSRAGDRRLARRRWPCPSRPGRCSSPRWPASPTAARSSSRCPTGAEAERLAARPARSSSATDAVELFPAWETLPFERVSARASRRWAGGCGCMWRLRDAGDARPRSSSRRSGRWCSGSARTSRTSSRSSSRPGDAARPRRARRAARRASATGASTRSSTGARSRCAARSSTCTRRPPTTRCASTCGATRSTGSPQFSVADQRSTDDVDERRDLPVPRAAADRRGARRAPRALVATQPWGREQWERLAEGQTFDGMESWLPWLDRPTSTCCPTCCPPTRRSLLVEPRRMRDRAAGAARRGGRRSRATLAIDVGRATPTDELPRLHARRSTGCSRTPRRRPWPVLDGARRSRHAARSRRARSTRSSATATRSPRQLARCSRRRATASSSPPTATGSARPAAPTSLADEGVDVAASATTPTLDAPGGRVVVAPLERGVVAARRASSRSSPRPTSPAAAASTAGRAARARGRRLLRRPQAGRLRRAPPARRRPLRRHGDAGDRRRRARLPAARVQGRRQALRRRPTRSTRSATTPAARRRRCIEAGRRRLGEDQGAGARRGRARSRRSWSCSTSSGSRTPGHAFAPDTPWQHEIEEAFPYEETPDQAQAIDDVKADMERADPDGPARVRRRRLRQDRGRDPRRVQGGAGRQAGRGPRADHAARAAARPDLPRALRRLPGAGRGAVAVPHRQGAGRRSSQGVRDGDGRRRDRHAPAARRTTSSSRTSACSSSTRSSASACSTRRRSSSCATDVDVLTLTATPIPRTLEMTLTGIRDLIAAEHAAGRPPADPHLRRRVRRARRRRGDPARAAARGPGVLRAQPRAGHRARRRATCASSCPRRGSRSPTARWTRARSSRSCSTSGRASTTCSCARRSSRAGIDMPTVNTLVVDRADLLGLAPAVPAARPGRPARPARVRVPASIPPDRALTEEAYERLKTIGESTELGSGFKIAMRDLEIRGAGNLLGAGAVGPHRRGRLRPLLPDGHRGGRPS